MDKVQKHNSFNENIILERMVGKQDGKMWTGFI
jgi:hypothetical protein